MQDAQLHSNAVEIERRLLAALCSPALDPKTRVQILERLAAHKFANPDHEIIFQALAKMPRGSGEHIRETLGARLTRLGFPDIDLEPIFEFERPSAAQISEFLRRLSH
jgi:hypothetical protein